MSSRGWILGLTEKAHFDLNEFSNSGRTRRRETKKIMWSPSLQDGFSVVSHDDFAGFTSDDGGDVAVARPFNAADTAADDGGSVFIAVYHHFNGFSRTAA